uniref:Odorant receptor n=1 Tax=Meteorus pulchricornis TaxID=51522 RepID=A0A1S5VFL0_9HYME|nr:olfactory receptor 23 [Meteorus pulchricornis]
MSSEVEQKKSGREQLWNSDTIYSLGLYRTLGKVLGIWPSDSNRLSSYIRVASVTIIQLWMSIRLTEQLLTKGNCGIITDIVDVLSLITCGLLTALKVLLPRIHKHKMEIIINSAVEDWAERVNRKSRNIMFRFAKIGRVVFITQMIGAYVAGFPLIFAHLPFISILWTDQLNSSVMVRNVPIGPNCWISPDWPASYYVAHYVLQSIQLLVVCTGYIGGDTFFFGMAMHVCGQFEVLYTRMKDLQGIRNSKIQRRIIAEFCRRHNHLLMLADNFEKIYNIIILAQVGADTLLTCITGIVLLISIQSLDFVIVIGLVVRIYLVCIQLFMYSYVGEQLSSQAEKLRMAIYDSPWYDMPPDLMRDMSLIIMRCDYSYYLTAGKIYTMNICNFKNIIKTMTSYFSILRLMFIDEPE